MYCAISFTFQSGDIQIHKERQQDDNTKKAFTFQSGDIQIVILSV